MLQVNFKVCNWRVRMNILMCEVESQHRPIWWNRGKRIGRPRKKRLKLDPNRYSLSSHIWLRDFASSLVRKNYILKSEPQEMAF